MATNVPFRDVLRLGSVGTQPVAVKRGLWRAGFKSDWGDLDGPAVMARVLGPFAVRKLKQFQAKNGLVADGVYGSESHRRLQKYMDDYAVALYMKQPPPLPSGYVQLPFRFDATHQTAGLPGYPAIDVFAKPDTRVLAPATGNVTRLSGHDPKEGGVPGGAYGWSIYLTCKHGEYFLTHFGSRAAWIKEGARVVAGEQLGRVCDAKVAGMASSLSHIHEGFKAL